MSSDLRQAVITKAPSSIHVEKVLAARQSSPICGWEDGDPSIATRHSAVAVNQLTRPQIIQGIVSKDSALLTHSTTRTLVASACLV